MKYAIFECTRTMDLGKEAVEAGFDAWVPTFFEWRTDGNGNRKWEEVLAISGYIYLPYVDWPSFRRWESGRYNCKLMTWYYGPGGLPGPKREQFIHPVFVDLKELQELDEILNDITQRNAGFKEAPTEAQEVSDFEVDDEVEILYGPFAGNSGRVEKVKKNGDIRIQFNKKLFFVNMNPALLRKTA